MASISGVAYKSGGSSIEFASCNNSTSYRDSNYVEVQDPNKTHDTLSHCESNTRLFDVYDEKKNQLAADSDFTVLGTPYIKESLKSLKDEIKREIEDESEDYVDYDDIEKDDEIVSDPFWFNDPAVLFDKNRIMEFIPNNMLSQNRNLNAIARLAIIVFVAAFAITKKTGVIYATIAVLAMTVYMHTYKIKNVSNVNEVFSTLSIISNGGKCNKHNDDVSDDESDDESDDNVSDDNSKRTIEAYSKGNGKLESFIDSVKVTSNDNPFSSVPNANHVLESNPDLKKRVSPELFKSVSEIEGDVISQRNTFFNKIQDQYLKQNPAEYFYGKNLNRHLYT